MSKLQELNKLETLKRLGASYTGYRLFLALGLLAIWVGIFAGLTHLLYGVHSYAALLSGITAAVVIIPSMFQPDAYIELALARVICTLIGVIVITVVAWFFTPESDLDKFYQQICRLSGHAFHL